MQPLEPARARELDAGRLRLRFCHWLPSPRHETCSKGEEGETRVQWNDAGEYSSIFPRILSVFVWSVFLGVSSHPHCSLTPSGACYPLGCMYLGSCLSGSSPAVEQHPGWRSDSDPGSELRHNRSVSDALASGLISRPTSLPTYSFQELCSPIPSSFLPFHPSPSPVVLDSSPTILSLVELTPNAPTRVSTDRRPPTGLTTDHSDPVLEYSRWFG